MVILGNFIYEDNQMATSNQIESALIYLAEMDIEIWSKSTDPEEEIWWNKQQFSIQKMG